MIRSIVHDPEINFTLTPERTLVYAEFLSRIGALKNKPASWKDYFFEDIHDRPGS
ncbi:MAG: hypothetical protein WC807_16200 [Hyphomicrobium sp.]